MASFLAIWNVFGNVVSTPSTIRFDRVDNLSNRVALDVQRGGDGTVTYKVTVPLKLLDLNVSPGMTIAGDIGVLRGNGFETLQRAYWSNKAGGLVSDPPGEAELTPNLWGRFRFISAYEWVLPRFPHVPLHAISHLS
jgi:hypothetical protein